MLLADEIIINAGIFAAAVSFIGVVSLSLIGWSLSNAVKLGNIATRLESRTDEHEKRITALEQKEAHRD